MSPEYIRNLADLADPDETWRTTGLFGRQQMPENKRQQHDTGVALRRYAQHIEQVNRALEEKRSVLITPISANGCAVRMTDTPDDHMRLRDARASIQPTEAGDCK